MNPRFTGTFFQRRQKKEVNEMTENVVTEEKKEAVEEIVEQEEIEEKEVWRITTLKANGSVWTKTYNDVGEVGDAIYDLVYKFPHIVLSRQTLKMSPNDYRQKVDENGGQKS
jgi:methionine salvage enolase-phosphatase E1